MQKKILIPIMAIIAGVAAGCSGASSTEADPTDQGSAALTTTVTDPAPPEDPVVARMESDPASFFNRYVTVTDASGQSSVRLRIVTNDADALEAFANSDFQLRVGPSPARIPAYPATDDPTDADDTDEGEDRVKVLVFEVGASLAPGMTAYAMSIQPRAELKLPWKNYYLYTSKDCVDVTRIKAFRRVYVTIWSRPTASAGWATLHSNDLLSWKETISRCDNGSYELKTKVRTKKSNAYSYSAWE